MFSLELILPISVPQLYYSQNCTFLAYIGVVRINILIRDFDMLGKQRGIQISKMPSTMF